jgi:hypothetical protein
MVTTFDLALDIINKSDFLDSIYTVDLLYEGKAFYTISVPFNFVNACFYTKDELKDVFDYLNRKFDELRKYTFTGIKLSIFVKPGKKREIMHCTQEITIQQIRQLLPAMKEHFIDKTIIGSVMNLLAEIIE